MTRVSVIVPAFNAESFIDETIRSVLAQTHTDIEVIVVDDGSTDGTLARLRQFGSRIAVHQQTNSGVAAARNRGARAATGDWLAFLDADDIWLPEKIEQQLTQASCDMVYTDRFNIGARGDLPELQSLVTPLYEGDLFLPLLLEGNFITASSVLLRRALFTELNGFFEGLQGTEDWDLWVRVAAGHEIAVVREPLVRYRFHPAGLSRGYQRMWRQREGVVTRALQLPRGRTLPWATRRRVWAQTWLTNASEAANDQRRGVATRAYSRAARWWPVDRRPYKETLKLWVPLAARLAGKSR